jgi:hypothetical protein
VLYAGCSRGSTDAAAYGVWKFDGSNWASTGGNISNYGIVSLASDSAHNVLYAGTGGNGVWKHSGTTWADTKFGPTDSSVSSLTWSGTKLYAGMVGSGVWEYDGSIWTDAGSAEYVGRCLDFDPARNILFAGTDAHGVCYTKTK